MSSATAIPVDNTRARRLTNLEHAKLLIKAGLYVFPSSGKTPLIPRFNRIDTEITPEDREAAIEKFREEHDGANPVHVGATQDPAVIKKMFAAHMDCVWSIACGPSNLVVVDADSKDNGPEKIGKHFEEHGLPEGCVVVPTQSGGRHYIFRDPEGKYTNSAGALKSQYGCDVRGKGGQYVSPGSIRQDGKTYGTRKDLIAFLQAYTQGKLPELPDHVAELIGTAGEASKTLSESEFAPYIRELEESDWPDHDELFDPAIGVYDIEALKAKSPEFAEAFDNPADDKSTARWQLAHTVLELVRMPVTHLAALYEWWGQGGTQTEDGKGSGNYRLRDIAREWLKNKDNYKSEGAALSAVVDDEDDRAPSVATVLRSTTIFENFAPAPDVIENLLPAVGLACIYADANVGKTFLAIEMLDRVMRGQNFFGLNTEMGDVLLVAGEGQEGLKKRLAALHKVRPLHNCLGIAVSFELPVFDGKPSVAARKLKRLIQVAERQSGQKVRLVVLDNLIGMIGGGDLHTSAATKPVLHALSELAHDLGVCIAVIHHENRSGGTAGSFAIRASVDVMLQIIEDKSGLRTIKVDKSRDGTKNLKLQFRLKYVPLGHNKWGNEIGSCVVEPYQGPDMAVEDDEEAPNIVRSDRREDRLRYVLEVFEREGRRQKAADESLSAASLRIALQSGEIEKAFNAQRVTDGLDELGRSTVQGYILEAVKSGSLEVAGTKGRPLYRLG